MPKTRSMAHRLQDTTLPRYRTPSLKDVCEEEVKPHVKLPRKWVAEDATKALVLETRNPAAGTVVIPVVLQEPKKRIAAIAPGLALNYGLKYCHKCRRGEVCFITQFYECYIAKYEMYSGLAIFQGFFRCMRRQFSNANFWRFGQTCDWSPCVDIGQDYKSVRGKNKRTPGQKGLAKLWGAIWVKNAGM